MQNIFLDGEVLENAVYGASVLGGGGGGDIEMSLEMGWKAIELGEPFLAQIDSFPDNSLFVVVSSVGAIAEGARLQPSHYIRTVDLIQKTIGKEISGFITSEVGPFNIVNGWIQSAISGLAVIDAPADGRAHPTANMGMMGLSLDQTRKSLHVAAGGFRNCGNYIELIVQGVPSFCSSTVREASIKAGGMVAVAREPVSKSFLQENACPGAISQAIQIGKDLLQAKKLSTSSMIQSIKKNLNATLEFSAEISNAQIEIRKGMDCGKVSLSNEKGNWEIDFVDAFMTLESPQKRIATFPDLILLVNHKTGLPLSGVEVRKGMSVEVIVVSKNSGSFQMGGGYRDREVFSEIEAIISKNIYSYY